MKNQIIVDDLVFDADSVDVTFSQGGWDLRVIGKEKEVERFGGEPCCPRILVYNINEKGAFDDRDGLFVDVTWDEDSEIPEDTYITLFGEGFSVLSGDLKIRKISGNLHCLVFSGVSDLPFTEEARAIPFAMEIDFEWAES